MKSLLFVLTLMLTVEQYISAQCNSGSHTVTTNEVITGSCIITGDLTILNGATLNVDLTSPAADTFVVRGNILLLGNAVLWVHAAPGSTGEQFIVSNSFNNQRVITTKDSSRIQLEYVEFRTQEGDLTNAASIYMNYNAENSSIFYVNKSWLDSEKAWLLFNLKNKSTLIGYEPNHLPTEIYLQDTAQVALHGPNTKTGMWFTFESITDTLNLPADQSQPFTWKIGRGVGGLNTQWYFEADTAQVGLGVQMFPTAKMVINGVGTPSTKEVTVALLFANGTDTLQNLTTGIQNTTVATGINGSVKLNNVNLGPIAWQLYVLMNENLYIKNSVVNEIGIAGPSSVVVDSSLLQLALLAAVGVGGSTMTVNNSEIWNQGITASNNSTIILNDCNVYGSWFSTTDAPSHITVNNGCFFQNPAGCTMNTALNWTTGQPYCNPFIPSGFPQILTPASITLNGVNSNCVNVINKIENIRGITIYPNPATNKITIELPQPAKESTLIICSINGQELIKQQATSCRLQVDISNLPSGIYFVKVVNDKTVEVKKIIKE
ncbi:MAG: T9SS type A sorting domain-containing protein [Bacteroidales bacterium]|nr:T9SS type A sorting domain-containing protein [Bacteroidales bacterium]